MNPFKSSSESVPAAPRRSAFTDRGGVHASINTFETFWDKVSSDVPALAKLVVSDRLKETMGNLLTSRSQAMEKQERMRNQQQLRSDYFVKVGREAEQLREELYHFMLATQVAWGGSNTKLEGIFQLGYKTTLIKTVADVLSVFPVGSRETNLAMARLFWRLGERELYGSLEPERGFTANISGKMYESRTNSERVDWEPSAEASSAYDDFFRSAAENAKKK